MSSGEIRHFKSSTARNNFERAAQAYKHGWRPKYASPKHSHPYSIDPDTGMCMICGKGKMAHKIK